MKLLLDTHAAVWWILDDPRLSSVARAAIGNPDNELLFSVVSAWELVIKGAAGRGEILAGRSWLRQELERQRFTVLPVGLEHVDRLRDLPMHHRDPFDRMLVAQAGVEKARLVTKDRALAAYRIPITW